MRIAAALIFMLLALVCAVVAMIIQVKESGRSPFEPPALTRPAKE
jgi:hypothetical protein